MDELQPKAAPPSRRDMLKVVTAVVCGAAAGVGSSITLPRLVQSPPGGWRFLTAAEVTLLESVCEQIIPADEDPGAKDAGVVNFIDRQLAGPYRRFQLQYRQGLVSLQQTSRKQFGKDFEQLSWDLQTALLKLLESGRAPKDLWHDPNQRQFFRLLCDHTMQGFYGSPRHGGNRDYASYKMLGLEYPRVLGQNRYREPLA